jgi:hypothetical protein
MAVLSLFEAAEQAATSKVDIWRAIQEGALPAQKTNGGGYAIDKTDLFRVFERKQPDPWLALPELLPAPTEASIAKNDEAAEPVPDNDVSAAFAALQAELKSLLGSRGEAAPTGEEKSHDEPRKGSEDDPNGRQTAGLAADKAKAGWAVPEAAALADIPATLTETRRTWWRRLIC